MLARVSPHTRLGYLREPNVRPLCSTSRSSEHLRHHPYYQKVACNKSFLGVQGCKMVVARRSGRDNDSNHILPRSMLTVVALLCLP